MGVLFGFLDMVSIVKVKLRYIEKITFGTSHNLITCIINLNQIEQNQQRLEITRITTSMTKYAKTWHSFSTNRKLSISNPHTAQDLT